MARARRAAALRPGDRRAARGGRHRRVRDQGEGHPVTGQPGRAGRRGQAAAAGQVPLHAHPTRAWARRHLGSPFGKTEAWILLDTSAYAGVDRGRMRPPADPPGGDVRAAGEPALPGPGGDGTGQGDPLPGTGRGMTPPVPRAEATSREVSGAGFRAIMGRSSRAAEHPACRSGRGTGPMIWPVAVRLSGRWPFV